MLDYLQNAIISRKQITAVEIGCHTDIKEAIQCGADVGILYHTTYLGIPQIGGMLPFCNPNEVVLQLLEKIRPLGKELPIAIGVCGTEPSRLFDEYLRRIIDTGVVCVQNFPTVSLIDGRYRANLEAVQIGFYKECLLMEKSLEMGLECLPLVFSVSEGLQMAQIGAKVLIIHMGAKYIVEANTIRGADFDLYWNRAENVAQTVKEKFPEIKSFVWVKTSEHADIVQHKLYKNGTAIDGAYLSVALK